MSHTKRRGESPQRVAIAIMAAGKGTRLKSKHPKVLHEVGGKPLLAHVIAAATKVVSAQDIYAIIGHEAERVRQAVAHTGINFVLQAPQRGTGHALMVARDALAHYDQVIVLSGDAPLITPETITKLRDFHSSKKAAMTILTSVIRDPTGYGRVIRKSSKGDDVQAIVVRQSVARHHECVPSAALWSLQHEIDSSMGNGLAHTLGFVADDGVDILGRDHFRRGSDNVRKQRFAANFVQHFRMFRFQPRAFTRS